MNSDNTAGQRLYPSEPVWQIGSPDGKSPDLVDTYKEPNLLGDVIWRVPPAGEEKGPQRWPLFHPSEADPDGGYRLHPYTVLFDLDREPDGSYLFRVEYLVIAPRLAYLEMRVNGVSGFGYLQPEPSRSGEIRLLSGLHTSIYSDGVLEVVVPAALLRQGENRLELIARDGGEFIRVERIEAVRRLDRMANGAGFLYQHLTFERMAAAPARSLRRALVEPTVIYRRADGGVRADSGALVEECHLFVELNGPLPASTLTLAVTEGSRTEQYTFAVEAAPFGHLFLPFELFDGKREVTWRLTGLPDGAVAEGHFLRRRKWKVYLTPHAHTDIGYTHRQWEVAERLCRNIDAALAFMERPETADYTYHLDSSWALEHYLATRSPAQIRLLFERIREGRIGVAGNYMDLLTQITGLEDLIRNGTVTDRMLRPEGVSTDFACVVDVASISASAPAVLEGLGIKYLVHANNQDRGPFRLNGGLHRISPFYWEGIGGGRVLVWLAKMYTELRKVCGSPPVPASASRGLQMWLQEYERADYAPDAVMLYGQEADNTDIDPQPAAFISQWNERYAYPQLIPSDVSSFFRYVEERWSDRFATVRGDSGAYWEDGALSSLAETIQVRRAQAALPAAERLEALAAVHTPEWAFPQGHFDEAWKQVLHYDEHTWGAFLSAREPEALLAHDQWAVKSGFARESESWATRLLHGAAVRHSLNWNNDGREVVAYNPHNWTVSGTIFVEIEPNEQVVEAGTGRPVPMRWVQKLSSQATAEVWVEDLPGLSYRRFILERRQNSTHGDAAVSEPVAPGAGGEPGAGGGTVTLENDSYRLVIDPAEGFVRSWYDKALDRELVDGSDRWGFGQLLYARGGEGTRLISNQADLPEGHPTVLSAFRLKECKLHRYEHGTTLVILGAVHYGELTVEWTLPSSGRWVDVRYRYNKEERLEKEAVYVAFPLALPGAEVESDSQLGWVNWDKEQLPGGCKEWLPLQTGILVTGRGGGAPGGGAQVFIASPEVPLFTIGEMVRGLWPKEMDLTGGRIFSYVANNYWHTNYKASQGGELRFGYRLTSAAAIPKEEAYKVGWEARRGLYGHRISFQDFRESRAPYDQPAGGTLAEIGTGQVALSTMTGARNGEGYVLRLQEISGNEQVAPVRFPGRKIARAWVTDLLENPRSQVPVGLDGTLKVKVPAWGLLTLRIEFAS